MAEATSPRVTPYDPDDYHKPLVLLVSAAF